MSDDQTRYEQFREMYTAGEPPPWDTGIVPPEVRALVEGEKPLPPDRALDVGCGTGVSAVYLARHGWQVTGVDWVAEALHKARARAAQAGNAGDRAQFVRASVIAPDFLPDHPPVMLWLDIGCMHGFCEEALQVYARHAARLVAPEGTLLLYAWRPFERDGESAGIAPETVCDLFATAFEMTQVVISQDTAGATRPSAWYTLRRVAQ